MPPHGTTAVVFGGIAVSSGPFLRCHRVRGNAYEQARPAVRGKILGPRGGVGGPCVPVNRTGFLGAT